MGYLTNFQILLNPLCKGEGTVELELCILQALPKDLKLLRFRYSLSQLAHQTPRGGVRIH